MKRHRPTITLLATASLALTAAFAVASPSTAAPPPSANVVTSPSSDAADEKVVLTEDFGSGMPQGWRAVEGSWSVVNGRLQGTSVGGQLARITFGPHLEAFRFEATVRFEKVENAARWASFGLDVPANGAVPWWIATMRSTTTAANGIEFAERTSGNTWNVTDLASAATDAGIGKDVKVKVEVRGGRGQWFFNGDKVLETRSLNRSSDGGLAFLTNGATTTFDDVRVTQIPHTPESLLREPGEDMTVIAHRGYSAVVPENTMGGLESALRAGADFVENDVQSSADGVPMVLHDGTLDRTTEGSGALSLAQSGAVSSLDAGSWFSPFYAGQRVPTSVDMLKHAKAKRGQILLEIKGPETRAELERIVKEVVGTGMRESTVIQSFDASILRTVHDIDPTIRLGYLVGAIGADPVADARSTFASTYNPSWGALAGKRGVVEKLHAAGIAVQPYTVNDPRQWKEMDELGVDGVITDRPGALVGWQAGRTAPAKPSISFLSPKSGVTVTRGDQVVPALDTSHVKDVVLTLDGKPAVEGSPIEVDTLTLGEHTLAATATGDGGSATATATFVVEATREGLLHLATDSRIPAGISGNLVQRILHSDWKALTVQAGHPKIPEELSLLIIKDATALSTD